jgi:hypothetical protein
MIFTLVLRATAGNIEAAYVAAIAAQQVFAARNFVLYRGWADPLGASVSGK